MKMLYLGPEKTYSNEATEKLAEKTQQKIELEPMVSLEAVAKSVNSDNLGVMAYYNYLEGLVQECLDLIYENNLKIIDAKRLPIVLYPGEKDGNKDNRIYSHPKALAQCSEWLWENYPESRQVPAASTAAAAKKVSEEGGIAIASLDAMNESGLNVLCEGKEGIGNKKHGRTNFTDFYLVARKNDVEMVPGKEYLSMIAITPHIDKPGLLAEILWQIAYHNLNNAKIHSRPALDDVPAIDIEPQMFYIEIMGHQHEDNFKRCVDSLKYKLTPEAKDVEVIRVLGSYEKQFMKI